MDQLSVPLLNRIVDAMFDRADPKADQNIWDLGRAALEVFRAVKGEQLAVAYGGPLSTAASELTPSMREWIERYGATGRMQTAGPLGVDWRRGDGGRVQMNPVPATQVARDYSEPDLPTIQRDVDYAAQLGEVERRLALKAPQYTGDTATKVDALAQDFQAADQQIRQQNQGIEKLKRELQEKDEAFHGIVDEIRKALDPDGQFEDESLIVLARQRMSSREARKQELFRLRERIGTEIEANSAEMLRRVLGAEENETLGQAAKRVAESAKSGWEQCKAIRTEHEKFEDKIRELVGAQPEVDDWDNPRNAQPTLDAVRRLVLAFVELSKEFEKGEPHMEISSESAQRESFVSHAQDTWNGHNEMKPLPGEKP